MMQQYCLHLFIFILQCYTYQAEQPYFPPQIVFNTDDGYTIAVDEVNQRAYQSMNFSSTERQTSFVMKHFPYAIPGTPESKNYVQLLVDSAASSTSCEYAAYWKYDTDYFNQFPVHWWSSGSSFAIKNYLSFSYKMVHSKNASLPEDYWYADTQCQLESGQVLPCQEIFFKKNTSIPLRYTEVVRHGMQVIQEVTNFQVLSVGKPDEKYFESIPRNWPSICRDFNLGVNYNPSDFVLDLNQSSTVRVSLTSPPHQINGNSTVRIQWKEAENAGCFNWSPKELVFNREDFQKQQTLTITRVKQGSSTRLLSIFHGGGFDHIPPDDYAIIIV